MNQVKKVLKNGVKVYDLSEFCTPDFYETQEILNSGSVTSHIDGESAYSERVTCEYVGVYEVKIEREKDYQAFLDRMETEKNHFYREYKEKKAKVWERYYNDEITWYEADKEDSKLYDEYLEQHRKGCDCSLCSFRLPTYEEWKTGKYWIDEKRQAKLGKTMRKAGFSQELLDFYSQQIKTEKTVYLTISDLPQHIAGMSFYAERYSWDGYDGTSCQDPRTDAGQSIHLAGSLHDNKLFVAMLHYELEDLKDMRDKLKARVNMRWIQFEGMPILIATYPYGNNTTKDELKQALLKLEEGGLPVFNWDVVTRNYDEGLTIREEANGYYTVYMYDEVHIQETFEDYVTVDCPVCGGSGEYEAYSYELRRTIYITCPTCRGSGEYEALVYVDIDEYVDVEDELEVAPYAEMYSHCGCYITIKVLPERIRKVIEGMKEKA